MWGKAAGKGGSGGKGGSRGSSNDWDWGGDGGGKGDWGSDADWNSLWGKGGWGWLPWAAMMAWGMRPWLGPYGKGGPCKGRGAPAAAGKGGRSPEQSKKVFVGGLPKVPDEDAIKEYFSQFGSITDMKMMYNDSGESRGYCFITFDSADAAQKVYDNYHHNEIEGKWVDCKPAEGSSQSQSNVGQTPQIGKPGDWVCPMCGDLVFAWRGACNMCGFGGMNMGMGMAMPPLAPLNNRSKPGDWVCQNCGDLVFSYRDKCNKCGQPKDRSAPRLMAKKGDWTCPNCGDLVFAYKDACSMCGTQKREVPAAVVEDEAE